MRYRSPSRLWWGRLAPVSALAVGGTVLALLCNMSCASTKWMKIPKCYSAKDSHPLPPPCHHSHAWPPVRRVTALHPSSKKVTRTIYTILVAPWQLTTVDYSPSRTWTPPTGCCPVQRLDGRLEFYVVLFSALDGGTGLYGTQPELLISSDSDVDQTS